MTAHGLQLVAVPPGAEMPPRQTAFTYHEDPDGYLVHEQCDGGPIVSAGFSMWCLRCAPTSTLAEKLDLPVSVLRWLRDNGRLDEVLAAGATPATPVACPTAYWTYPNGEVVTGDCVLGVHDDDHETRHGTRWHFGEYGEIESSGMSAGLAVPSGAGYVEWMER